MPKRISEEKKGIIRKFCLTHPKGDAARIYKLSPTTVNLITKGIHYKKRGVSNEDEKRKSNLRNHKKKQLQDEFWNIIF